LSFRDRKGLATTVIAGIVVVVIVVAAAGAYFAFSSGGSSSGSTTKTNSSSSLTTSTTHAGTTTSSTGSTTSSTGSTSSASSTSSEVSTSTTSTFSCATTYSTTTGTPTDFTPQYIKLIQQFSSIEFKISDTNGTKTTNETISYMVTSASGGIYNLDMNFSSGSGASASFVVDSNNDTVLSVTFSGFTQKGSVAKTEFDAFMGIFGLQQYYGNVLGVFTSSAYFHSTGTPSRTFGTTTFTVTTYEANSLPESFTACGITSSITAYTLEVGTPPGTSLQFITYLHIAGTDNSNKNYDTTFQLVSMTVA
jgi:hypothetical protein